MPLSVPDVINFSAVIPLSCLTAEQQTKFIQPRHESGPDLVWRIDFILTARVSGVQNESGREHFIAVPKQNAP
jgi:hypothetical protein